MILQFTRNPTGANLRSQRGQVVPLLAVLLVLAGLAGLGLVRLAVAASDRSACQAAADAVALAGAGGGRRAAVEVAAANGAELRSYRSDGYDVVVQVVRRGHTARARARWSPEHLSSVPSGRSGEDRSVAGGSG